MILVSQVVCVCGYRALLKFWLFQFVVGRRGYFSIAFVGGEYGCMGGWLACPFEWIRSADYGSGRDGLYRRWLTNY